jgi:hypothetical protein
MVILVLLPIVVSVLHYLIIGPRGVTLDPDKNVIQRFSMAERIFHFIKMLSFGVVAGTGKPSPCFLRFKRDMSLAGSRLAPAPSSKI